MEYRTLSNTNLTLSAITFGAWAVGGWMWGSSNRVKAIEAIRASYDMGVTTIDTAPVYGQGFSEQIVGEALHGIPRDKVQILTKFGMVWDEPKGSLAFHSRDNNGNPLDIYLYAGKESVIKECEDSLRRLKTDYIDLLQIHWPDKTTPMSETFEAVSKLIEQGKVRYAGVCNFSAAQIEEAEQYLSLASVQIPYSMVNRDIEKETVPYCIKHHKSILAYSPLERGLLTGKMKPDHHFEEGDHRANHPSFTPENIRRVNHFLEQIKPIADSKGITLSQLVLRWTLEQPGITIALVGARDATQAVQNAEAGEIILNPSELEIIQHHLQSL
jgi:aryl-alcohol dehydrogenase-like predicted oxidoreductase